MSGNQVFNGIRFSIAAHAAWAPGLETEDAWLAWANSNFPIRGTAEPRVAAMPAMLRRRAGAVGKMALEVAYRCLDGRAGVPAVFCSRHGECTRSVALLQDLVQELPLSPTAFSLSVHNATAGLLSIARHDQVNHSALSAGDSGVEHALIEACGLLADGAPEVLLVVYDSLLPDVFREYKDCEDQPFAWAWLIRPADAANTISLTWEAAVNHSAGTNVTIPGTESATGFRQPAGLDVLGFQLRQDRELIRVVDNLRWYWRCHAG